MSTFYPENDYRNYLKHYGVKGMRWRHHKSKVPDKIRGGIISRMHDMGNTMAPNRDPKEQYRTKTSESIDRPNNNPQWDPHRANRPHRTPGPSTHNETPPEYKRLSREELNSMARPKDGRSSTRLADVLKPKRTHTTSDSHAKNPGAQRKPDLPAYDRSVHIDGVGTPSRSAWRDNGSSGTRRRRRPSRRSSSSSRG